MTDESSDETINIQKRIASSLEEVGRHIADKTDTDVGNYRMVAERYFIQAYCRQHSDLFTRKGQLDFVYSGTPPKGHMPPEYDEDAEEPADHEKVRFPDDDAPETDL